MTSGKYQGEHKDEVVRLSVLSRCRPILSSNKMLKDFLSQKWNFCV